VVEPRTWVEISRSQIAANYRAVREAVGPQVEVAAVVKADAYGHGAVEVGRVLVEEGLRWLAVSSVEEAVTLRQAGLRPRILVMADNPPGAWSALTEYELTPVVHSLGDLRALNAWARKSGISLAYHLKLDTGMGRLGVREGAPEIARAVEEAGNLRLEGLMTHFASAADFSTSQTEEQISRFDGVASELEAMGIRPRYYHLASTNSIAYARRACWRNMVRPGHALYGYVSPARGPAPTSILHVRPALSWKARVLVVKEVPAGALVGYGGLFRASRPTRIAILAVGYADGFPHRLANRGRVIAAGRLVPVIGAVSMDLTTIDVTECPELRAGDAVTLLGCEGEAALDAQQLARLAGTISYDLLCGIRARVRRVYV